MKSEIVRFRFKGKKYDNHTIDVKDLAPALLALGNVCSITNNLINHGNTKISVFIKSDIDQNCFELGFQLVQSLYDHLKYLISHDDVATTKQILEWIGIFSVSGGVVGYWPFLKWLNGRNIKSATDRNNKNVEIKVDGDNNNIIVIPKEVAIMASDDKLLSESKHLMSKIQNSSDGQIEFEYQGKVTANIDRNDADCISANTAESIMIDQSVEDDPQTIKAWIQVYSPVYDVSAPKWRFKFGNSNEYFDISETTIAKDAIRRGGAMVNDAYHVELQITQKTTNSGHITNDYKVLKVLDFRAAAKQGTMYFGGNVTGESE